MKRTQGATGRKPKMRSFSDALKHLRDPGLFLDAEKYAQAIEKGGFILSSDPQDVYHVQKDFVLVAPAGVRIVSGQRAAKVLWNSLATRGSLAENQGEVRVFHDPPQPPLFVTNSNNNAVILFNCLGDADRPFIIAYDQDSQVDYVERPETLAHSGRRTGRWKFYWIDRKGVPHVRSLEDLEKLPKKRHQLETQTAYNVAGDYIALFGDHFGDTLLKIIPKSIFSRLTKVETLDWIEGYRVIDHASLGLSLAQPQNNSR